MEIESESFLVGFGAGFVICFVLGFLARRFTDSRGASRRPAQKASVTVKAEKSPSEIVHEAAKASVLAFLWGILFIGALVGVIWFLLQVATS